MVCLTKRFVIEKWHVACKFILSVVTPRVIMRNMAVFMIAVYMMVLPVKIKGRPALYAEIEHQNKGKFKRQNKSANTTKRFLSNFS